MTNYVMTYSAYNFQDVKPSGLHRKQCECEVCEGLETSTIRLARTHASLAGSNLEGFTADVVTLRGPIYRLSHSCLEFILKLCHVLISGKETELTNRPLDPLSLHKERMDQGSLVVVLI